MGERTQKDLGKFFLVGVVSTVVDYLLLNVFAVWLQLPLVLANSIAAPFSSFLSYKLNKKIVFEERMYGRRKTLLLYVAIVGFGILVIQNTLLHILEPSVARSIAEVVKPTLDSLGLHIREQVISINIAKVGASLLMALWNFFMLRRFVFVTKAEASTS